MRQWDVAVIGAGILGLATALELSNRFDGIAIVVLEKEPDVATHQTGRNSGVIHSGLYYRPGSLKAELCVAGADALIEFCQAHEIPYRRDGKVVVAVHPVELPALEELERRGTANGLVGLRRVSPDELSEIEPHAHAVSALHVPSTGTVDFGQVAAKMAQLVSNRGAELRTSFEVRSAVTGADSVSLRDDHSEVRARSVINCAGLYADHLAEMMGVATPIRVIPFRGEYFDIGGNSARLVRTSIYPVPDSRFPFLGVHLTHAIDGTVHAGPNAVLALAREGYEWTTIRWSELWATLSYPGFLRLARKYWRTGLSELIRSLSTRRFAQSARQLVPEVHPGDVSRGQAGVRAQAVSPDGSLVDDFLLVDAERSLHVLNAPSPAATASLKIAEYLTDRASEVLAL